MSRWKNESPHELCFQAAGRRQKIPPGQEYACPDHLDYEIATNTSLPLKQVEGSSRAVARCLAHAVTEAIAGNVLELAQGADHEDVVALKQVRALHHRLSSAAHQAEAGAQSREAELQKEIESLKSLYEMQEEELEEVKAKLASHLASSSVPSSEPVAAPPAKPKVTLKKDA